MTGFRATIRGHDFGQPMSLCAFVSRVAMIGGRPQILAEAAGLAMLGGFSGCQRPNSEAMGAGKKAGACPDEAQSTAEAVFSEKLKCAVYVHSDVPLDALGRNADFGMRVMLVDSYGEREGGSAR
jgi:hypothetical protein